MSFYIVVSILFVFAFFRSAADGGCGAATDCTSCTGRCKSCKLGASNYFICSDTACPGGLSDITGNCVGTLAPLVTSLLACPKKVCKAAGDKYVCLNDKEPSVTCKSVDSALEEAVCVDPSTHTTCDACGTHWCKTCGLSGASKKGFLCAADATCPSGSSDATSCSGLDMQVTELASGSCKATTTACKKDSTKYCVAAQNEECTAYGLDKPDATGSCKLDEVTTDCATCAKAHCKTCKIGSGFVCIDGASCPVGLSPNDDCQASKATTVVVDPKTCSEGKVCKKDSTMYCIAGEDKACKGLGDGLVEVDEGTDGGCTAKKCDVCVKDGKCHVCKSDSLSVCVGKDAACPKIGSKDAVATTDCTDVKGTFIEGQTCDAPNKKCKKDDVEVCIGESCKEAGLDPSSNAGRGPSSGAMGLVGLAVVVLLAG